VGCIKTVKKRAQNMWKFDLTCERGSYEEGFQDVRLSKLGLPDGRYFTSLAGISLLI